MYPNFHLPNSVFSDPTNYSTPPLSNLLTGQTQTSTASSTHIIFVDARVQDFSELAAHLQGAEVFTIHGDRDGIAQMTEVIEQYSNIASVHIISHGSSGEVLIGNSQWNQNADLQSWTKHLNPEADILFYGCNVAADADGLEFVQSIAQITGADVAGSNDVTGHAALGGDWELEVATGAIESATLLNSALLQQYQGILPTYNGKNYVLTSSAKTWAEAEAEAQSLGGHLVAINDATEEAWLRETFHSTEWFWTGLNDRQVEGTFEWSSGEAVSYTNWMAGQPDDWAPPESPTGEDAVPLVAGEAWNDIFETGLLRGIVEIPLPPPPPPTFTHNGSTYHLTTSAKTWAEAEAEAQSLGGHLVAINDAAEEAWLRETFHSTEWFWTGLNDRQVEGTFEWSSGEAVNYTNWATGQPDDWAPPESPTGEDAVPLVAGEAWNDIFETGLLRGIVEIKPARLALKDSNTVFVNEAADSATVTVVRTGNLTQRITVEYTTNELGGTGSAQAGLDYTIPTFDGRVNTGQIIFEVGESEKSFNIPIINDALDESNETFSIGLQNSSAGALGTPRTKLITIIDNDNPNTVSIGNVMLNVSESVSNAVITVTRSGDVSGSATVDFSTSNGTAIAGSDYTATSGTLTFAAGQTSRTISIPILNDAIAEGNEMLTLQLMNPIDTVLGSSTAATINILDDDFGLGNLTRSTVVSGLNMPTAFDWTPDGRYMLVAQKNGIVRVLDNGTLRSTPVIDLSTQVNNTRDRGLLGLALHPNFPSTPYLYLAYTYDPPETAGRTGLGGPDGNGNRPSRLVRVTVNPTTMIADSSSLVVLVGKNSTWAYTSRPDGNSTGDLSIPPSGIVNGTTITAPANQIDVGTQDNDPDRPGIQNQNIRDYLATDSESHSIGAVHFGPDGMLYLSTGDGTSYNFADPRTVRVQDINNLSGKVLRIDPINGQGLSSNPFFNGDPDSNQSKVFYSGFRNPFRFTFDPITTLPIIGDVGWFRWEEINTGVPGSNFGWPYLEGPDQTPIYSSLSQAVSFYNNGNRNSPTEDAAVFPLLSRSHGAPDNANAIIVGDFFNSNMLIFGDINNGTFYSATFNASRQISNVQVFDSGIPYLVDMEMGPDGRLYAVNLWGGSIVRWNPA